MTSKKKIGQNPSTAISLDSAARAERPYSVSRLLAQPISASV